MVRVHPEILEAERLPEPLVSKHIWDERYEDINAHERYLARNGTVIRKFFLHLSKAEQRRRFLARLDEPAKNWKFSLDDVTERESWPDYQEAYEATIQGTATKRAPWYVVPADHKWYTRLVVASAIVEALPRPGPRVPRDRQGKTEAARQGPRGAPERGGLSPAGAQALRNAWTARAVASGCSRWGAWPAPGTTSSRVSAIRSRELLRVGPRHQPVVLAPDQQRGRGDAVDALLEPLVGDRPDELAGRSHGPREARPRERRPPPPRRAPRTSPWPPAPSGPVEHVRRHLRGAQQHPVDHRRVVAPEADRIDEDQPLHPRRAGAAATSHATMAPKECPTSTTSRSRSCSSSSS